MRMCSNNLKVKPGAKSSRFVVNLKQPSAETETKGLGGKTKLTIESKLEKLAELDCKKYYSLGKEKVKACFLGWRENLSLLGKAASGGPERIVMPAPDQGRGQAPERIQKKYLVNIKLFLDPRPPEPVRAGPGGRRSRAGRRGHDESLNSRAAGGIWRRAVSSNRWIRLLDQMAFFSLAELTFVILKKLFGLSHKICYGIGWLIAFIARFIYLALGAAIKPPIKFVNYLFGRFYRGALMKFLKYFSGNNGATHSGAPALALAVLMKLARLGRGPKFKSPLPPSRQNPSVPVRADDSVGLVLKGDKGRLAKGKDFKAESGRHSAFSGSSILAGRPSLGYLKPALAFAGVLLLLILPVKAYTYYKTLDGAKGRVLGASESALANLMSGGRAAASLDFSRADENFRLAGNNFLTAESELGEINGLLLTLASLMPNQDIRLAAAAKNITRAGSLAAAALKNLNLAAASLFDYRKSNLGLILSDLSFYGHRAMADLDGLTNELERINSALLPEDYRQQFISLRKKSAELERGLGQFIVLADDLKIILGQGRAKRYLLAFQNNSELRASGGFIGSFALIDFFNGQIKNIEAPGGGSYDTDAGLLKKIKSPEPLRLVRPDWHFWDANWWPDWPASARKLAWFYENSDGATVDGVIGLTPTVMENVLKIIGPVDLKDKYGVVINADNFWLVTQEFAEQKPNLTKRPKKIIGDLLNKIIEELPGRLNKGNLINLLKTVEESLNDKNILLYFSDQELEARTGDLGWDGKIRETDGDYLAVINTNIAGGKSDRKIKQEIIHRAEIQSDGAIIDSLTVKRTHWAVKGEPFSGVRNVDWLRIYVPLGSKLISADGFKPVDKIFFKVAEESWPDDPEVERAEATALTDELSGTKIYNELNKTVFANWSQVDPGEAATVKIKYQLPFKLTLKKGSDQGLASQFLNKADAIINQESRNLYSYSLLAQKQPGMNSSTIESELELSGNFKPIWSLNGDLSRNGWQVSANFDQDKLMAVIVEEK